MIYVGLRYTLNVISSFKYLCCWEEREGGGGKYDWVIYLSYGGRTGGKL